MRNETAASYDPEEPLNWYLRCGGKRRDGRNRRPMENEEVMDSTIEQILNVRRDARPNGCLPLSGNGGKMDVCPTEYIFSIPPLDSDWIAVTLPDYYRGYLAIESTKSVEEQSPCEHSACSGSSGLCWQESGADRPRRHLLGTPFEELLVMAEQINEVERRRATALQHDIATESNHWEMAKTADKEEDLWSSKYQPRAYIDLLSDDSKPLHLSYESRRQQEITAETLSRRLDAHGRPEFKVALISGPPGIGKTTMAHMVARHCGYHVQEINASDDRTLESFSRLLSGALQMKRTLDANPKPHCVIVDEIDGAPAPSVNYLVSLAKGATSKRGRSMLLRRPVICICNDLYAPALRDLRRIALVLHVPPLEAQRLAERLLQNRLASRGLPVVKKADYEQVKVIRFSELLEQLDRASALSDAEFKNNFNHPPSSYGSDSFKICVEEELSVEMSVLRALCRKTDNDIRSCINTLQLLVCNGCAVRHSDIEKLTFGSKDSKRSLFDVWAEVFHLPRLKRLHECAGPMSENRYMDTRSEKVLTAAARCEQEDRLFDGLFENYPLVQFKDRHLRAIRAGLRWVEFMDHLNRRVYESQLFELLAYRRYVVVAFHLLFSSNDFTKLTYPQRQKDVLSRIDKNTTILQSVLSDLPVEIRATVDRSDLIMDVLPFMLPIIQPEITSNNPQLYTARELSTFRNAARIMAQYNVTYRQQKSADGNFEAVMEPPLEEVALFAVDVPFKPKLSYNVRQAIAQEAQAVRLSSYAGGQTEPKERPVASSKQFRAHPSSGIPNGDNSEKIAKKRKSRKRKAPFRSFLTKRTRRLTAPLPFAIEFKFQSGSDCLIRRDVRMRDLLKHC